MRTQETLLRVRVSYTVHGITLTVTIANFFFKARAYRLMAAFSGLDMSPPCLVHLKIPRNSLDAHRGENNNVRTSL